MQIESAHKTEPLGSAAVCAKAKLNVPILQVLSFAFCSAFVALFCREVLVLQLMSVSVLPSAAGVLLRSSAHL